MGGEVAKKFIDFILTHLPLDIEQQTDEECILVYQERFFKAKIATKNDYFKVDFFCSIWPIHEHEMEYGYALEYAQILKEKKSLNQVINENVQAHKLKL